MDAIQNILVILVILLMLCLPALLVASLILLLLWQSRRSRDILKRWASENGYTVVSSQMRVLFRGPFWWRTSSSQSVFKVMVRDVEGRVRTGFIRVGGFFLGMMSDQANVEWTDEREP